MKNNKLNTVNLALAGAIGVIGAGSLMNDSNPFNQQDLTNGYENGHSTLMGKLAVAEGTCGEAKNKKTKNAEGKCGEGKCGESAEAVEKHAEGKCGEGKCGESAEAGEKHAEEKGEEEKGDEGKDTKRTEASREGEEG